MDCYIGDSSADRHACTTSSGTEISFFPTLVRIFSLDETCLACLFLLAGFLASLPGRGGKGLYILYSTVCTLCTRLQVAPFFEGDISFRARNFNWQLRNVLLGKKGESRHVISLACGGITHDTLKGIYPMPPSPFCCTLPHAFDGNSIKSGGRRMGTKNAAVLPLVSFSPPAL